MHDRDNRLSNPLERDLNQIELSLLGRCKTSAPSMVTS